MTALFVNDFFNTACLIALIMSVIIIVSLFSEEYGKKSKKTGGRQIIDITVREVQKVEPGIHGKDRPQQTGSGKMTIEYNGSVYGVSSYVYDNIDKGAAYHHIENNDVFCIFDYDNKEVSFLDYARLPDIAPASWNQADDKGFDVSALERTDFDEMFLKSKEFAYKNIKLDTVWNIENLSKEEAELFAFLFNNREVH